MGTYLYDGLNRRIWKQSLESGTLTTRDFYYSKDWQVFEERTGGSSSADRQYIWGVRYRDDLISRDRIGVDRLYSLADYFQTTSIANTSGVIQERYVYRAFGDVGYYTSSWGTSTSSFGWTYLYGGYQLDPETNLYQVRYRYYHSALGRWLNRDPLPNAELLQGANLYWYVQNNAVNNVDSLGLETSGPADDSHVSPAKDSSWLIFKIHCPICFKVDSNSVQSDYHDSQMYSDMFNAVNSVNTDPTAYAEGMAAALKEGDNEAGFGGLKDKDKISPNCSGDPVTVLAWMRTRLVGSSGSGWKVWGWRNINNAPDPQTMLKLYEKNTRITYNCVRCDKYPFLT